MNCLEKFRGLQCLDGKKELVILPRQKTQKHKNKSRIIGSDYGNKYSEDLPIKNNGKLQNIDRSFFLSKIINNQVSTKLYRNLTEETFDLFPVTCNPFYFIDISACYA